MPRYYLHVHDDLGALDEEGSDFPDLEAARAAALDGARDLVCDQIRNGYLNLDYHIEVASQEGQTLLKIRYRDALELRQL